MCLVTLESYLDLVRNIGNQFSIQSDLKGAALAIIRCRYLLDKWFHVYTDGSAEDAIENTGAGAFSSAYSISYPVGKYCDNFDVNEHDYLQRHLHRIGVKGFACCPLCHQGEMNGDHRRHFPIVLEFFVDNPMESNFDSFLLRHHFIGLLVD
ncbi:hypothetical protein TNCV_4897351 [Trichonephila clavipes]|nr:hypothetical protein TNCV_4897351 [Trichonephila clavipes]